MFCVFVPSPCAFGGGRGWGSKKGLAKKKAAKPGKRPKGPERAWERLKSSEHAELGAFVLDSLSAGVKGTELAEAIRQKLNAIKKARFERKAQKKDRKESKAEKGEGQKKGPGEALKHGLEHKDLVGLGKFVNEKLAEGLRGRELSEAIRKEAHERKEDRKNERAAKKVQRAKKQPQAEKSHRADKPKKPKKPKKAR